MAKRTPTQNNALHKYFELLADALNDAGLDMKRTLRQDIDIPWTKETIKEYLWKPIQRAQVMKGSTTELNTSEVSKIYETLNRHLGEKTGVFVPFPSVEEELKP